MVLPSCFLGEHFGGKNRKRAEKMSFKTDLETNFAECVLNAGKVILGEKQRSEMDPDLQKEQNQHLACHMRSAEFWWRSDQD